MFSFFEVILTIPTGCTFIIKSEYPRIKIILLSMVAEYRDQALAAGVDAFVNNEEPAEVISAANLAVPNSNKIWLFFVNKEKYRKAPIMTTCPTAPYRVSSRLMEIPPSSRSPAW